jgi:hypothetical protein
MPTRTNRTMRRCSRARGRPRRHRQWVLGSGRGRGSTTRARRDGDALHHRGGEATASVAAFSRAKLGRLFAAGATPTRARRAVGAGSVGPVGRAGVAGDGETMDGLIGTATRAGPRGGERQRGGQTAHAGHGRDRRRAGADAAVGKLVDDLKRPGAGRVRFSSSRRTTASTTSRRPRASAPIVELGAFAADGIEACTSCRMATSRACTRTRPRRRRAPRAARCSGAAWSPTLARIRCRGRADAPRRIRVGSRARAAGDLLSSRGRAEANRPIDTVGQTFLGNHGSPREVPAARRHRRRTGASGVPVRGPTHADLGTTIAGAGSSAEPPVRRPAGPQQVVR